MATATDDTMATSDAISVDTLAISGSIPVDIMATSDAVSIDTLATSTGVSEIFKVTHHPLGVSLENTKVNVRRLYLRQIMTGPGANQSDVTEPNAKTGLGQTGVSNWDIYDGVGSQANLVATGEGMYTHRRDGKWNQWFTLEFINNKIDDRFKGSTLQVMGSSTDDEENEWAIVGGTGKFAMARGIIKRRVYSIIGDTLTHELTIEFFCHMKEVVPAPTMRGPWGGNGGSLHEMEGKSKRLESVTFYHAGGLNAMEFSYIDEAWRIHTTGRWGEIVPADEGGKTETIKFGPGELVKQIAGVARSGNKVWVSKLQIVTNLQTYGPYGADDGTPFSYTIPEGETVVGFFARTDLYVTVIGVYTI